jgi:hypothetical protein
MKFLNHAENKAIVSDAFWYAICKFFPNNKISPETYENIEENLLNRIAKNYVNYFLSIDD